MYHLVVHVEVPEWNSTDLSTGLPKYDFTTIHLKFASAMSQDEIVKTLCAHRAEELESLLEAASTTSIAASLCGNIFEAYAFRIMQDYSNYPWRARMLVNDGAKSPEFEFRPYCGSDLEFREFYNTGEVNFSSTPIKAIYKANRKIYAGIAGFCADGIFNMTVAAKHDIVMKDELVKLITEGSDVGWFRIYASSRNAIGYLFFVPWYAFESWTRTQPLKRRGRDYAELRLELVQIAVEVPRSKSLISMSNNLF